MLLRIQLGWLIVLLGVHPVSAQGRGAAPAGPLTGDKLPPGYYSGKLLSLPSDGGPFTLEITTPTPEVKSNAVDLINAYNRFTSDYQSGLNSIQKDLATGRDTAYDICRAPALAW